jgi:hypothetical protein
MFGTNRVYVIGRILSRGIDYMSRVVENVLRLERRGCDFVGDKFLGTCEGCVVWGKGGCSVEWVYDFVLGCYVLLREGVVESRLIFDLG